MSGRTDILSRFRSLWTPPALSDLAASDQARLAFLLARWLMLVALVFSLLQLATGSPRSLGLTGLGLAWSASFFVLMELVRRGRLWVAMWAIPGLMLVGVMLLALTHNTSLDIIFGGIILTAAVATLLLGRIGALVFGALGAFYVAVNLVPAAARPADAALAPMLHALLLLGILLTCIVVLGIIAAHLQEISRRDRAMAEQLAASHRELDGAIVTLRVQAASVQQANDLLAQEVSERQRMQATLEAIVAGTAAVTGDDFMRSLSLELVRALGVRFVIISELLDDQMTVQTLACRDDEYLRANFVYALEDTPCADVIRKQQVVEIERNLQALYPLDKFLAEMGCESYYAEPLPGAIPGVVLGHLALLDVQPLQLTPDQRILVKVFAARTAVELERNRADKALQYERAQLAARVESRTVELVEANRGLNRSLQARNEFLTNVSHELRTPLNAIIGLTDALTEGVYGELSERQARSLETVNQSGRQLLTIINDILDVAKLEAGHVVLLPGWLLLEDLCRACLDIVRPDAEHKGIRIHHRHDNRLTTLWADSARLRQILVNLLSNAIKFTHAHGEIGLDISLCEAAGCVEFSVWDTGIGIAPADTLHLFQPFVQIDGRLNRRYGGTGLGLIIVKRLVDLHKGSISVHSVVGQGSRFVVSLPLIDAVPPETAATAGPMSKNV